MKPIEFYREKATDAIQEGLSHEKGSKKWKELLDGLKQEGKYQKMISLVRIIKELAPDMISSKLSDMLPKDDPSLLPFNPDKLEFKGKVDQGGEHYIFLLESTNGNDPSYVLKMNYQYLGGLEKVRKSAVEFRRDYEKIKEIYSTMPGIVPEELTIITSNLKTGKPIMATIQKFYGSKIRGLLNDFGRKELVELFEREPKLLDEFRQFCQITEKEYDKKENAVDLLGVKNLAIVETRDGSKLIILDPHSSASKAEGDKRKEKQEALHKLKNILDAVTAPKVEL